MERRRSFLWVTAVAIAVGLLFAITSPGRADLAENEFNSGNGETWNDPNSASQYYTEGWRDWEDIKNLVTVKSDIADRATDDSFGQGTKEDNSTVSVGLGSIPPNKSDLTNFYIASEQRDTTETDYAHTFLYLAWTRTNALGSANMDFELNQVQPNLSAAGSTTISRTAGDVLITYDFDRGGKSPSIAALFWVTSGTASRCYAGNRLPCWGDRMVLLDANAGLQESEVAEGGIAQGAFYDNVLTANAQGSDAGTYRAALTFGEMAVDLSVVLPNAFGQNPTKCSGISSIFLKSRSSSSFTAELKDFIAPQTVSFSNCGAVKVVKQGKDKTATETEFVRNLQGATFRLTHDATANVIDTKTTDSTGSVCFDNILLNTERVFTVTELSAPTGYADSPPQQVTVEPGTSCSGTGAGAPAVLTFVDEPLTTITVGTTSLAGAGVTTSSVQCSKNAGPGTDTGETTAVAAPHTTIALQPGTYTCTVVIDP